MEISFYNNVSEKEKIGKTLKNKTTLDGFLKEGSSVTNPVFRIQSNKPVNNQLRLYSSVSSLLLHKRYDKC